MAKAAVTGSLLISWSEGGATVRVCASFWARFWGSARRIRESGWLIPGAAVHLLWGAAPLDLIFVNRLLVVMRTVRSAPRGALCWTPGAVYTLELPAGTAPLPAVGERLVFTGI